jgi:hypothetical protein
VVADKVARGRVVRWPIEVKARPSAALPRLAPSTRRGDRTEAAYRRGDLFEKRRHLMEAWATHCTAAGVPYFG